MQFELARQKLRTAMIQERKRQKKEQLQTEKDAKALRGHYESIIKQRLAAEEFKQNSATLDQIAISEKRRKLHTFDPQTGSVFDRSTGKIRWPSLFDDSRFTASRKRLDALFAERSNSQTDSASRDTGLGSRNCVETSKLAVDMKQTLRTLVGDVDCGSYVTAKKFLAGLAYETRFVAVSNKSQALTSLPR